MAGVCVKVLVGLGNRCDVSGVDKTRLGYDKNEKN